MTCGFEDYDKRAKAVEDCCKSAGVEFNDRDHSSLSPYGQQTADFRDESDRPTGGGFFRPVGGGFGQPEFW